MNRRFGLAVTGGIAGLLVMSALVLAQDEKREAPAAAGASVKKKAAAQDAAKAQPPEVPRPNETSTVITEQFRLIAQIQEQAQLKGMVFQKGRPAAVNIDNQVEQYMRQARPLVRAELMFVRKVCALDVEAFRKLYEHSELASKEAMKKFLEAQTEIRARARTARPATEAPSAPAFLHERLTSAIKSDLTPEQFARYQSEVEKRGAFQKASAIAYLLEAIDQELYLSRDQRAKVTESLSAHWDPSWLSSLEYRLYGNKFFPAAIDPFVTPYLDSTQAKIWAGVQRVGRLGGAFGMLEPFFSDPDALLPERGEDQKAGSPRGADVSKSGPPAGGLQKLKGRLDGAREAAAKK